MKVCASELNIHLNKGVYGSIVGLSYETVTESNFLLNCKVQLTSD